MKWMQSPISPREDRFLEYAIYWAAAFFIIAYGILFTDPAARVDMAPWFASTVASIAVVVLDERRLDKESLENAFPKASRTLDLIAVSQIAVVLHFLRTRWPREFHVGKMLRAWGVAIVGGALATLPQIAISIVIDPGDDLLGDLVETLFVLVLLPLVLLAVWRVFVALRALFDIEHVLVLVGLTITFGSAAAIALAIPAPLWGTLLLLMVWVGAIALAIRQRRLSGMNRV